MPFSPLDALMQVAAPTRPIEPPPRNDGPGAFAPALEQAYQAESPRSAQAPLAAESKPKVENSSLSGEQSESEQPTDEAVVASEGSEAVNATTERDETDSNDAEDDANDQDAVEISAEGATAAAVVQGVKGVEQLVIVKSQAVTADADVVKEVDKEAAAEAAKKQTEAAAEAANAAALREGELEATEPEGESASDQAEETAVATLNSTRRRQQGDDRKGNDASAGVDSAGSNSDKKLTADAPVEAQATDETEVSEPTEEIIAETPAEPSAESREPSRVDETAKGEEAQQDNSRPETTLKTDAAAATVNSTDSADVAATEAAASAPTHTPVDTQAPTTDATPRTAGALDRLMAGHSLKSSKETSDPNGMPTVDRARFVQRVEGAMKAAQQRDGKIQVRLSPPDLGSIKIELAVQNGVLSAKLEAETPAARNLLLDSLPALRERLAQQDIRIEKFDVDVRDHGGGQADDRTADQSGERQSGRPRATASRTAAVSTTPSPRELAGVASAASGLDVRV